METKCCSQEGEKDTRNNTSSVLIILMPPAGRRARSVTRRILGHHVKAMDLDRKVRRVVLDNSLDIWSYRSSALDDLRTYAPSSQLGTR